MKLTTGVRREVLDRYCKELPGCNRFLGNFFGTCEPFEYGDNLANYLNDLRSYSPTNRHIKDNLPKLVQAFTDIAYPVLDQGKGGEAAG